MTNYESPVVEVMDVEVEQGFAVSATAGEWQEENLGV